MLPEQRPPLRVALIRVRPEGAHATGDGTGPPLGLLALAGYARHHRPGRYEFAVHDTFFATRAETVAWLSRVAPQVVGLSVLTPEATTMHALLAPLRAALPHALVVLGGPHATAYPDECLALATIDAVVPGEGEIPFADLLEAVDGVRPWEDVRGVSRRGPDGARLPMPEPPAFDVATAPMPAYDLLDLDAYEVVPNIMATIVLPPHRYVPIFTSRGCPYRCVYCHSVFGKRFRERPVPVVVDEIATLAATYGVQNFHVYDDIFNGRRGRMLAFCTEVRRRGLDVRFFFVNGLRFDTLDREQLTAMRDAGVVYVAAAIESASPRMQARIGKKLNVPRLLENVAIADELGLFVVGLLLFGIPGETRDDLEASIRVAESSRLHFLVVSVLNPFRGTAIGEQLSTAGIDVSAGEMIGFNGHGKNYAGFPEDEFAALVRAAYRRFWTTRRALAYIARHPVPESYASVLRFGVARAFLLRLLFVLGLTDAPRVDTNWMRPRPLPAWEMAGFRWLARRAQRVAQRLVR